MKEQMLEGVLLTKLHRKPPRWRMEHFTEGGKIKAAMLIKGPHGRKEWHVMLDDEGNGYAAPTKRKAVIAFRELQAALISEENKNDKEYGP